VRTFSVLLLRFGTGSAQRHGRQPCYLVSTTAPELLLNRTELGQNIHIIRNAVSYINGIEGGSLTYDVFFLQQYMNSLLGSVFGQQC
jgi:hypothetical protein